MHLGVIRRDSLYALLSLVSRGIQAKILLRSLKAVMPKCTHYFKSGSMKAN